MTMPQCEVCNVHRRIDSLLRVYSAPNRRDQAKDLLQKEGMVDGSFLVRENSRNPGCYGLSLVFKGNAKHYFVAKTEDAKYAIEGGVPWATLPDLLEHYMKDKVIIVIYCIKCCQFRSLVCFF